MNGQPVTMRTAGRHAAASRQRSARRAIALKPETVRWIAICTVLAVLAIYGLKGATHQQVSDEALDDGSTIYTGTLSDGKFTGHGSLTLEDGDQYVGGFAAGRYDGSGRYVSADGWTYDGTFQAGQIVGSGTVQTATGVVATDAKDAADDAEEFLDDDLTQAD